MFKSIFIALMFLLPSFLVASGNPAAASAVEQERKDELADEVDVKSGIQASWQDLHPYAMVARVVKFYKTRSPKGLSADEVTRKRVLDGDLRGYDAFNKWIAYVFLMLDHRVAEEEGCFDIYQSPILEAVSNFSGLSRLEQRRLENLINSDVVEESADDIVKDSRVRQFACKKALQKHQVVAFHASEVTGIPEGIINVVLHYGDVFPWGASVAEVLQDRNTRAMPQYQSLFDGDDVVELKNCMLRSLDGIERCPKMPRILRASDNFLDHVTLDCLEGVDDVKLSNNFIVEVVLTQNRQMRYVDLTDNPLEELPRDFYSKLPGLVRLKSPLVNYNRHPRKDKTEEQNRDQKRCTCAVQ